MTTSVMTNVASVPQAVLAAAMRALPDEDLRPLATHVDLRAFDNETLATLARHVSVESGARTRLAMAIGEALLRGDVAVASVSTARRATPSRPASSRFSEASQNATRAKGEKRPAAEIEALADRVVGHLRAHPNEGVEAIARALEVPTKDLALPIKKLIALKRVAFSGQKRATRYRLRQ